MLINQLEKKSKKNEKKEEWSLLIYMGKLYASSYLLLSLVLAVGFYLLSLSGIDLFNTSFLLSWGFIVFVLICHPFALLADFIAGKLYEVARGTFPKLLFVFLAKAGEALIIAGFIHLINKLIPFVTLSTMGVASLTCVILVATDGIFKWVEKQSFAHLLNRIQERKGNSVQS